MLKVSFYAVMSVSLVLGSVPAFSQDEISAIPFDSIPGGTSFISGAGVAISLQADTAVTGDLSATGEIAPGTGIRFPDGTVQTTASTAGAGITANAGLYSNTIADFTPPFAYTEVCVKAGAVEFDIHAAGEPTAGGNCLPGDTGWIIERFERDGGATFLWAAARMECLKSGMRVPEPFEWQFSCDNSAEYAVSDMEDSWEWTSNSIFAVRADSLSPPRAALDSLIMGNGSCSHGAHGTTARNDGATTPAQLRCAR